MEEKDPFEQYNVVMNHEEQYSIWPTEREIPAGWQSVGVTGTKQACLDHIEKVWTDMRPLSLRKKMEEWKKNPPPSRPVSSANDNLPSLVDRLCSGDHPLVVSLRPERSSKALQEAIGRGYTLIKFTETRGGTEIGVELDTSATNASDADFDRGVGRVRLVGQLTLDMVPVRCIADVDLASLAGTGHLERVTEN